MKITQFLELDNNKTNFKTIDLGIDSKSLNLNLKDKKFKMF